MKGSKEIRSLGTNGVDKQICELKLMLSKRKRDRKIENRHSESVSC